MKTIIIFTAGSIANYVINQIATHPQVIDVLLGCLVGALLALLLAMLFIGPSDRTQQQVPKPVTPKVNKTQRKPRRIIEQPAKAQYGLNIFNYQPTEWGIA